MGDNITRPDHYCEGRKYEPKDVIRDWGLNFNLGSCVKYISRAGRKGDKLEDLQKAKQFLQFEIEGSEEDEDLKWIVQKIDNDEVTADDIPSDLYHGYRDIRDAIARQALRKERNRNPKSDIGMTCKEAAEIGDAMAKGFEEGFKEAEENSDIEIETVNERMISAYVYGLFYRVIVFNSIPDEYKPIVIDKIAQKVLDNQWDIVRDIHTKELQDMVVGWIIELINNDELDRMDIPEGLYNKCERIRATIANSEYRKAMDAVRKYAEDREMVTINFEFEVDPDIDTDTVNVHVYIKNKED